MNPSTLRGTALGAHRCSDWAEDGGHSCVSRNRPCLAFKLRRKSETGNRSPPLKPEVLKERGLTEAQIEAELKRARRKDT